MPHFRIPASGSSNRKRALSPNPSPSDSDSDVGAIRFEPEFVDEDQTPRRPKRRKSLGGGHLISGSTRAVSEDSQEEAAPVRAPRHRRAKTSIVIDSDDDTQPPKRKLIKGKRPPTPEEEDDILDAEDQVLENRFRSRGKMTPFQKNLEKLKVLKGKKRAEISPSSSEGEQSESSEGVPFKGAKPHHSGESDDSDSNDSSEEDDGFIVEDEAHGVPATQLPPAFSLSTHQDLSFQFKIICQLFVNVAVQPLADRRPFFERALKEIEYFSVPLQVTRRKLRGMRDSLVASSVWRPDFKKTLETYPKFNKVLLDFAVSGCDACHLGGRLSTLRARLSGNPYDEYDFEDISDDGLDEDEGEDEDDEGSDTSGEQEVKAGFNLGRFCASRTQVYHEFSHWEHSLYKALQREIMQARDETHGFIKVAHFGGIRPPQDLHDGDKIMDWLDQRGIIENEWQKVRRMMDSALKLESGTDDPIVM